MSDSSAPQAHEADAAAPAPAVLIVAGEASADLHGARLVQALRQRHPAVQLFGVGGQGMRQNGFDALVHTESMSVAGLTEVLLALPRMWRMMRRLVRAARSRRPAVAVLIDMPDFNLRLARRLKTLGIPVVYYISPQVWAWRRGRVRQIRVLVDQMLVILPFEQRFYEEHGVVAHFVGHPLVEALPADPDPAAARRALGLRPSAAPVVALLPGSRKKEVARHLPAMLQAVRLLQQDHPQTRPVIPVASTIAPQLVQHLVAQSGVDAAVVDGQSTQVLAAADAAVVCSGTSTLQAALLSRPMVVVYRLSWLSYQILKRMVKVAHIALVNLIAGKTLVPELIQGAMTPRAIAAQLRHLLDDTAERRQLKSELAALRSQLGRGDTAARVAEIVGRYLERPIAVAAGAPQDRGDAA